MEININNKVETKFKMKNIFSFMFMFLIMVTSGFSFVIFNDNQAQVTTDYNSGSVLGYSNPNLMFNNASDITYNFKLTTTPLFIVLSGTNRDENFSLMYYDEILGNFVQKHYTAPNNSSLILEFTPQEINDQTTMILSNATGNIAYSYVFMNDNQRGMDNRETIFSPLINGVIELININISIWVIIYYLFISSIIFIIIGGIIYMAKKWYDFGHNHSLYKKNKSNHK